MLRASFIGLPTVADRGSTFPPLTLTHLATVLGTSPLSGAVSVRVTDLQLKYTLGELDFSDPYLHAEVCDLIQPRNYDVLLIPTMCNNLPLAVSISEDCKRENPAVQVVIGGVQATLTASSIIEHFPTIDIVVRGEGERTLLEIVAAMHSGSGCESIPGITLRRGREVITSADREFIDDLNQLPVVDFGVLEPLARYQSDRRLGDYEAFIDVGRGCPFRCSFCAATLVWGRRSRQKDPADISRIMNELADRFGIGTFYFNQDEFTADCLRTHRLCEELRKQPRKLRWKVFARLSSLDLATMEALVTAGCKGVFLGIESGCPERLERIRKTVPLERAQPTVSYLTSRGVECVTSLILGFPDETWEEIDATLNLGLQLVAAGATVALQFMTPHPGTELWMEHGRTVQFHREFYRYYDNAEFVTPREEALIQSYPDVFTVFHNYRTDCQPFSRLFNLYYDYKRLINPYAARISSAITVHSRSPVRFHDEWRRRLAADKGILPGDVVDDRLLAEYFGAFLEQVPC